MPSPTSPRRSERTAVEAGWKQAYPFREKRGEDRFAGSRSAGPAVLPGKGGNMRTLLLLSVPALLPLGALPALAGPNGNLQIYRMDIAPDGTIGSPVIPSCGAIPTPPVQRPLFQIGPRRLRRAARCVGRRNQRSRVLYLRPRGFDATSIFVDGERLLPRQYGVIGHAGEVGNPYPPDGATGVPRQVELNWRWIPGDACDLTAHMAIVDFGSNPENLGRNWEPPSCGDGRRCYNPGLLAANTTYYWRAIGGYATSPVWRFTTGGVIAVSEATWGQINSSTARGRSMKLDRASPPLALPVDAGSSTG